MPDMIEISKCRLEELKKKEKALEIIKKKKVNVFALLNSETLDRYNSLLYVYPERQLTQEEYDLLRENLLY